MTDTHRGRSLVLAGLALASCRLGYDVDPALNGGGSSGQWDVFGSTTGEGGAMDSPTSRAGGTGGDEATAGAESGGDTGGTNDTGGTTGVSGTGTGGTAETGGASDTGGTTGVSGSGGTAGTGGTTETGGTAGTGGSSGGAGTAGTGTGGSGSCTVNCEPTGIALAGEALTAAYGGDGGTVFSDRCPAGQVLVGFVGYSDPKPGEQWFDRLQAVCGTLSLAGAGPYSVKVGSGLTLPMRGLFGVKKFSVNCPTDALVIGFEGRSGLYFDQITLYCAPLAVSGSAGNYTLAIGSFTVTGPAGGSGGSAFARTDCPPGWIANGAEGASGDFIDKLGLACTEPSLTY